MPKNDPRLDLPGKRRKIWRYMDFAKFVSLLHTGSLYFVRADKLDDPFEGSQTAANVTARDDRFGDSQKIVDALKEFSVHSPEHTAINCWHMNKAESAAMWAIYGRGKRGIAIQSTFARLDKCLTDEHMLFLGKVQYIDFRTEYFRGADAVVPFYHKRKSFKHERELRATLHKIPANEKREIDYNIQTIDNGLSIEVDLKALIACIYVSPGSPDWYYELVEDVVGKYGHVFKVKRSELDDPSVF